MRQNSVMSDIEGEAACLTAIKGVEELVDKGKITTPLQDLIEYNVTNGRGYIERNLARQVFLCAMRGEISAEDMKADASLMNKQKVYENYREQERLDYMWQEEINQVLAHNRKHRRQK